MSTSTEPAFRAALQTALQARGGLAGVDVHRYEPGDRADAVEYITLSGTSMDEEEHVLAGGRVERYTVDGRIVVRRAGGGDDIAHTAHLRAHALADEIRTELESDETVSGTVFYSQFVGGDIDAVPDVSGRLTVYGFRVNVEAHL